MNDDELEVAFERIRILAEALERRKTHIEASVRRALEELREIDAALAKSWVKR